MAYPESVSDEAKVVADFVESLAGDKRANLISEAARLMFRQGNSTWPENDVACQCWTTWRGDVFECALCVSRIDRFKALQTQDSLMSEYMARLAVESATMGGVPDTVLVSPETYAALNPEGAAELRRIARRRRVHLNASIGSVGRPRCGVSTPTMTVTTDRSTVTCGNCLRMMR